MYTLLESLCDAWPHAYAARMLYTPNGRSYGLRRCTDYTLPLNLPPREGDLLSRAGRAPIGTRRQMVFNRIGRRSVHTIGRASCKSDVRVRRGRSARFSYETQRVGRGLFDEYVVREGVAAV